MAGLSDLIGGLLQGGMTSSASNRMGNALGQGGLGQPGGLLEQVLGSSGGNPSGGGMFGGLMDSAKDMLGGQGASAFGSNPLATGGLGALAGALLGGGSGSIKGALGGGAMAMLAGLAFQAFKNRNHQPDGARSPLSDDGLPLAMHAPAGAEATQALESQAAVILRGMITAAKSDGEIDQAEREKIIGRMQETGADEATRRWVMDELRRPMDLDRLIDDIQDESLAAQVYVTSLFAIEVDTQAEVDYLRQLAQRTGLDAGVVRQLHHMVGVA